MTFADWVAKSRARFREQPVSRAGWDSACAFVEGGLRRTVEPRVGRPIWERGDWDVCVVADAARGDMTRTATTDYDHFPEAEDVAEVWSNASCSIDWIERTFQGRDLGDVGYVTANPFTDHDCPGVRSADLRDEGLGHLRCLYETEWTRLDGGIETVPPERVTDHAIDAWRRRDELGIDQLVVHYMQPHEPYRARAEWGNGDHKLLGDMVEGDPEAAGDSVFPRVRSGDISLAEFKRVYLDNHHWVFEDVHGRLRENIDGTMAITADHGNALGEWGRWHHPPGMFVPAARTVPWFEISCWDQETVTPDVRDRDVDAQTDEQLRALGYQA